MFVPEIYIPLVNCISAEPEASAEEINSSRDILNFEVKLNPIIVMNSSVLGHDLIYSQAKYSITFNIA